MRGGWLPTPILLPEQKWDRGLQDRVRVESNEKEAQSRGSQRNEGVGCLHVSITGWWGPNPGVRQQDGLETVSDTDSWTHVGGQNQISVSSCFS